MKSNFWENCMRVFVRLKNWLVKPPKVHQLTPTHQQFVHQMNNKQTYLVHVKNLGDYVALSTNLTANHPAWKHVLSTLNHAITNHHQIVFTNFCLSWKHEFNAWSPILIHQINLLKNLVVLDFSKHEDRDVQLVFHAINELISDQVKNYEMHLMLSDDILIYYQPNKQYGVLYSNKYQ